MKKLLLVPIFIILSLNCYSQIVFEKGYFINNSDQKVECLIKNVDWKNNPTEFTYKLSGNTEEEHTTIESVKEFGIYNISKYSRHTVNIDRSGEHIKNMSTDQRPEFNKEQLFLKVLIEGNASLYIYEERNLRRYFYNKDNSTVEQLIYKRYKSIDDDIKENISFKQQLRIELICPDITMNTIKNIDYTKNDLVDLFVKYNECTNLTYIKYGVNKKKNNFNLAVRPGTNFSSLKIQNTANNRTVDFGSKLTLRFGIEAEFFLPFNNNIWAFIIEPTYQYFKSEGEMIFLQTTTETRTTNVEVDYKSIEIPFGLRYYLYLKNNAELFFNSSIVWDFPISNSSITGEREDIIDLEVRSKPNFAFGVGYQIKNRYNVELRFATTRQVLNRYGPWDGKYKTLSLIFGFKILKNRR